MAHKCTTNTVLISEKYTDYKRMGTKQKAHVSRAKVEHFILISPGRNCNVLSSICATAHQQLIFFKAWFTFNIEKKFIITLE